MTISDIICVIMTLYNRTLFQTVIIKIETVYLKASAIIR